MARFWLGPWAWNTDLESPVWIAPAGSLGALDLRSLLQCGTAITPLGFGLFVTANTTDLGSSYSNLGTDPERLLTETQKRLWESTLLLPRTLVANRLMGIVYETLTLQADPTGDLRCLPLMPNMRRRFEVWLAQTKVSDRPWSFTAPEFDVARDTLKRVYRQLREGSLEGRAPPELYRKWLGFQVRKYRLTDNQYRALQPSDLPDETPLEPTTTIADSFNRADQAPMGNSAEGWSWTEVSGSWAIATNQASRNDITANASARAETDLSSDDHYAQFDRTNDVGSTSNYATPCARFAAAAETYYAVLVRDASSAIFKRVAGTFTSLQAVTNDGTSPHTYKIQANGSTIEAFKDAVSLGSLTDTAITGNLRTGISLRENTSTGDNVEAADLAAAAVSPGIIGGGFFGPGMAA